MFNNEIIYPKPSQPAAQQESNMIQTVRLASDPAGHLKWKRRYYLFLEDLLAQPPFHIFFFSLKETVFLSGIFKVCSSF